MRRLAPALLLTIIAGLLAVLAAPPSPASAHAGVLTAEPAPGAVVAASPDQVRITFTEPVAPVPGRVIVLAPDGERISGEATVRGAELTVPVRRATRPLGTYLVSYRVISARTWSATG